MMAAGYVFVFALLLMGLWSMYTDRASLKLSGNAILFDVELQLFRHTVGTIASPNFGQQESATLLLRSLFLSRITPAHFRITTMQEGHTAQQRSRAGRSMRNFRDKDLKCV
jgi:hypothetical protein